MPMLDITAPEGTFTPTTERELLARLTTTLLTWERATEIPIVVANTGAYLHTIPIERATAGGAAARVIRIEILTPPGSLSQAQRQGITADATKIASELAAGVPPERVWVLFREAVDGGWGIAGRAFTNADIAAAISR